MLFSWGMQRQGQLGLGNTQPANSTPRPISFLQNAMAYSVLIYLIMASYVVH